MFITLLPYFSILVLLTALVLPYQQAEKRWRNAIEWFCLILFVLFFGLRGNVGDDFGTYQKIYDNLSFSELGLEELGFNLLVLLFSSLHFPFRVFLFTCSLLTNLLLFRFLKQQKLNVPLALCVFWGMSGVACEVDFIRSTLAMMVFVNSIPYLLQRDALRFFAWNAVALSFHSASRLYFPLYFFLHRAAPRWSWVAWLLFGVAASYFQFRFLDCIPLLAEATQSTFFNHLNEYVSRFGAHHLHLTIASVERVVTGLAIIVFYHRLTGPENGKRGTVAVGAFAIYYFFYTFFSSYALLATRLANQFIFCYWLLWPSLLTSISSRKARRWAFAAMFIYLTIRLMSLSMLPQWRYTWEG